MDTFPSEWILRHAHRIQPAGEVLDLACGAGRHARWLAEQGFKVHAVDHNEAHIQALIDAGIDAECMDVERPDAFDKLRTYDAIVVTRFLYRPLLLPLLTRLKFGGILLYETFMEGNAVYGKPSNPDFLLNENELREVYAPQMHIIAFEQGYQSNPRPAILQSLCAQKNVKA